MYDRTEQHCRGQSRKRTKEKSKRFVVRAKGVNTFLDRDGGKPKRVVPSNQRQKVINGNARERVTAIVEERNSNMNQEETAGVLCRV